MAHTFQVDRLAGIEIATYSGDITADDIRRCWQDIDGHPEHRLEHHLINDMRRAEMHRVTPDSVRQITKALNEREHKGLYRKGRTAILADPNGPPSTVTMLKLYLTYLEVDAPDVARRERIFTDEAEAHAWLHAADC